MLGIIIWKLLPISFPPRLFHYHHDVVIELLVLIGAIIIAQVSRGRKTFESHYNKLSPIKKEFGWLNDTTPGIYI